MSIVSEILVQPYDNTFRFRMRFFQSLSLRSQRKRRILYRLVSNVRLFSTLNTFDFVRMSIGNRDLMALRRHGKALCLFLHYFIIILLSNCFEPMSTHF